MNEFEIIKQFFLDTCHTSRADVLTGIGDDAARVLDQHTVITVNITLQEQHDFQSDHAAASVGHLLLAPALAQLIARGAEPSWALLSLGMPQANSCWLQAFSTGLLDVARLADVQLVGGDTTRSPNIRLSLNCHGLLLNDQAEPAYQPKPDDLIYVVGNLGESNLAILALQEEIHLPADVRDTVIRELHYPAPPFGLNKIFGSTSVFSFPITKGLYTALATVVKEAGCGASLYVDQLPCSEQVESRLVQSGGKSMLAESPQPCTLAMIIPADTQALFEQSVMDCGYTATWVGVVESLADVRLVE